MTEPATDEQWMTWVSDARLGFVRPSKGPDYVRDKTIVQKVLAMGARIEAEEQDAQACYESIAKALGLAEWSTVDDIVQAAKAEEARADGLSESLTKERAYWDEKLQAEKARADRAVKDKDIIRDKYSDKIKRIDQLRDSELGYVASIDALAAEKLRLIGYISTMPPHEKQHPEEVLEWWNNTEARGADEK